MCDIKIHPWDSRASAPEGHQVSIGPQTKLGKGLRSAYKKWLWKAIQARDPYVISQLNHLRSLTEKHATVVLLYDHEVIGVAVRDCLKWGGWGSVGE